MRLKRKNISNLKFSIAVIDYLIKTLRLIHRNILKFQDKLNLSYEPVKNLRYNIHCFDVMLIFPK